MPQLHDLRLRLYSPVGEIVPVRITGAMTYDLIGIRDVGG